MQSSRGGAVITKVAPRRKPRAQPVETVKSTSDFTPTEPTDEPEPDNLTSFYEAGDSLKEFTEKVDDIVEGSKATRTKKIKEAYYSNEFNQLMRKPNPKAKLSNSIDIETPNSTHEIDLLEVTNDSGFRYVMVLIDIASRYVALRKLRNKTAKAVADAVDKIYKDKNNPLERPVLLRSDQGAEFNGEFKRLMGKDIMHKKQPRGFHLPFVERVNQTVAKKLYSHQTIKELETSKPSKQWISRLPEIENEINTTTHSGIDLQPVVAMELDTVPQGAKEFKKTDTAPFYPQGTKVRYLLRNDEYQDAATGKRNVERRRATDILWSKEIYVVEEVIQEPKKLTMHRIKHDNKTFPSLFTYWRLQPVN